MPGLRADCGALERDLEADARRGPAASQARRRLRARGRVGALDEARRLRDESRRVIAEMQASYAEEAGVRQLKIKHNNVLGYFIETPQAPGEALLKPPHNATFIHRQTMAGAMRFYDQRARRPRGADRLRGRPGARARTRGLRAPSSGLRRGGRDACAASARRWPRSTSPPRSPNSRSSATGPGRWSTPR